MVTFLASGLVLGLSAGFSPGPLLALVLSQTLRHGAKEGVKVAAAPLVTDLPILLASVLLLSGVSEVRPLLGVLSLLGSAVVLRLAWAGLRTESLEVGVVEEEPRSLWRGAAVNALSPHPYVFWLTVGGPTLLKAWSRTPAAAVGFAAIFLGCLVGAKSLLALIAGRGRHLLTDRAYRFVMKALGALLLLFACVLLRDGLVLLGL